jgi:hypothetical protein
MTSTLATAWNEQAPFQPPYLPFPELVGLVEIPILRPDGSICDQPGYDPQTRLYYAPPPDSEPCCIPSHPTSRDIDEALAFIWDTFGEFPYASQADRANTLGLLMTPLIRPIIRHCIPISLLDAPKKGVGKTMLVILMSIIATGRPVALMPVPSNEEEWEKRVTTVLMKGQTLVCLDNVRGVLESAVLDLLLTSEIYTGRLLGQSAMPELPNRSVWTATGNNLKVGGDLARRAYWIRLDPKMSHPWTRTGFRHPDLTKWVTEQRVALIRAIFVLVRAWYAAGKPQASEVPVMGTFSHWANTIGSILAYVGVEGFLGNMNQFYQEADETSTQWETFLQAWHDIWGSNWIKAGNVVERLSEATTANSSNQEPTTIDLAEALPERLQILLNEKPNSFRTRFGQELKKRVDECFGENNLHLEQGKKDRRGIVVWRVISSSTKSAGNAGNAGNSLTRSQVKNLSSTQQSAGNAGNAGNSSVNSHGENGILFQKDIYTDQCNGYLHPQHSQIEKVAQTSLESGSIPLENGTQNAIKFPAPSAFLQPAVPSSLSNDQSDGQIAHNTVNNSNDQKNTYIFSSEANVLEDDEWEEFTI